MQSTSLSDLHSVHFLHCHACSISKKFRLVQKYSLCVVLALFHSQSRWYDVVTSKIILYPFCVLTKRPGSGWLPSAVCWSKIRSWAAAHNPFNSENCEAPLLIDAANALNYLICEIGPRSIQHLCPSLIVILLNYFMMGAGTIFSQEGTTQGDPLAIPMPPAHLAIICWCEPSMICCWGFSLALYSTWKSGVTRSTVLVPLMVATPMLINLGSLPRPLYL